MNSCVLMAEIVSEPQLRSTQDNLDVAEMIVQFDGLRDEDPPATVKVLGWGNLASDIKNNYRQGDRIVIEGRLSMNTIDMREGYKEKRAELVASRIFTVGQSNDFAPATANMAMDSVGTASQFDVPPVASRPAETPRVDAPQPSSPPAQPRETTSAPASTSPDNADWDEIPF